MQQPAFVALFLSIVMLGAAFRFPELASKPLHGDEANQGVKAAHLLETGDYTYDPFEHHGPTLYYLTLPVFWLCGTHTLQEATETQLRIVPAIFGVLSIALLWGLRDALGRGGVLWAALLTAISNAMVYYSRYYIQESLFVCFALAAIVAGWRFAKAPGLLNALLLGAMLGLLHATKETAIVLYAAGGTGVAAVYLWERIASGRWYDLRPYLRPALVAGIILAALAVSVAFYSSFGTHPRGVLDSILTYGRYFQRADGTGSAGAHDKPFLYYLQLLFFTYREPGPWWTEGFALVLSAVGALLALRGTQTEPQAETPEINHFRRFISVYSLLLVVVFSGIAYKTPWNLLPFWQPLLLLAGLAVAWLTQRAGTRLTRAVLCLACCAAAAHAGRQSWQGSFLYPADTRNPYIYAHTTTALARVLERVEQIAAVHPQGEQLVIAVVGEGGDYWPLPWYLRHYPNVGYWNTPPEKLDADIVIASARFGPVLMERLGPGYHAETGALRPNAILGVFVKTPLWDAFMAGRSK